VDHVVKTEHITGKDSAQAVDQMVMVVVLLIVEEHMVVVVLAAT
jgi:hypothetical protein